MIKFKNYCICFLSAILMLNSCDCGKEDGSKSKNNDKSENKVTTLTFKINLNAKDSDGYYIAKVNEKITISADAVGPNKNEIGWIANLTTSGGALSGPDIMNLMNNSKRAITDVISFTPTQPVKLTLTCMPSKTEEVNGVKLYEGMEEFKIKIQP